MLTSMTGFGYARLENEQYSVAVEIKTINSKFLDLSHRIPKSFSDKEADIKQLLTKSLERGKINLNIEFQRKSSETAKATINKQLVKAYYADLEQTAAELGASGADLFRMALQMPEAIVYDTANDNMEEEWKILKSVMEEAITKCVSFRHTEGENLAKEISTYIGNIAANLAQIEQEAPSRIIELKQRIKNGLTEFFSEKEIDFNRMEQELIYYIEKLDISEEIIRLKSHLKYFADTMKKEDNAGKKLGFISQEIGREINTIGSKANNAKMQQWVVSMKDELEKIKEQLMNVV